MFVWVGLMFFVVGAVSCLRGGRGAGRATSPTGPARAPCITQNNNRPSASRTFFQLLSLNPLMSNQAKLTKDFLLQLETEVWHQRRRARDRSFVA